ncbi:YciI family protein [Actinomadura sp. 6N118]|uniref:YciI family protein n=1 Tax=Actinomadura sp. 6N118 TaxID=3375151 RepID=UPI0037A63C77
MFLVLLTYNAPTEKVDEVMDEHLAWLDEQYAAGVFLASGRKVPRTGGVILAAGHDRAAVEEIATRDPFWREGVASFELVEFTPTRAAPELQALVEPPD